MEFSKRKFQSIILPSAVLEFIAGFMEENGLLAPSPKKKIRDPQYRRSPRNLKCSQALAASYKKKVWPSSHKKKIFVGRMEYMP